MYLNLLIVSCHLSCKPNDQVKQLIWWLLKPKLISWSSKVSFLPHAFQLTNAYYIGIPLTTPMVDLFSNLMVLQSIGWDSHQVKHIHWMWLWLKPSDLAKQWEVKPHETNQLSFSHCDSDLTMNQSQFLWATLCAPTFSASGTSAASYGLGCLANHWYGENQRWDIAIISG